MKKEEVENLYESSLRLRTLKERRRSIQSRLDMMKAVSYEKDYVQESNYIGSKLEENVINVVELLEEIDRKIADEFMDSALLIKKFYDNVDQIESPVNRAIMELRCISGKTFEEISSLVFFSKEGVRKRFYKTLNSYFRD